MAAAPAESDRISADTEDELATPKAVVPTGKSKRELVVESLRRAVVWGKEGWLPFHPEGVFRRVWDVLLLCCILYSSFAVPFQLAFNTDSPR